MRKKFSTKSRFTSYGEFFRSLMFYQYKTGFVYNKNSCTTVSTCRVNGIKPNLRYYWARFCCSQGPKGSGKARDKELQNNPDVCPAMFILKAKNKKYLKISDINDKHNHPSEYEWTFTEKSNTEQSETSNKVVRTADRSGSIKKKKETKRTLPAKNAAIATESLEEHESDAEDINLAPEEPEDPVDLSEALPVLDEIVSQPTVPAKSQKIKKHLVDLQGNKAVKKKHTSKVTNKKKHKISSAIIGPTDPAKLTDSEEHLPDLSEVHTVLKQDDGQLTDSEKCRENAAIEIDLSEKNSDAEDINLAPEELVDLSGKIAWETCLGDHRKKLEDPTVPDKIVSGPMGPEKPKEPEDPVKLPEAQTAIAKTVSGPTGPEKPKEPEDPVDLHEAQTAFKKIVSGPTGPEKPKEPEDLVELPEAQTAIAKTVSGPTGPEKPKEPEDLVELPEAQTAIAKTVSGPTGPEKPKEPENLVELPEAQTAIAKTVSGPTGPEKPKEPEDPVEKRPIDLQGNKPIKRKHTSKLSNKKKT
ncbi:Protein of unknown function [Cotesia congregata]|uniref:ZSWIM3 N-terminal domain-containing protein n=1 Tax=Cotesia congregata TaxID=51543 RepID=A0A8J2E2R9_COTCN|nr:Protein of unknown function [Cotesia congregata]